MAIKYAPAVNPIKGNFNLFAIDLVWLDNPGESFSSVSNTCHKTAHIYADLSGGLLKFDVLPRRVRVNFTHSAAHVPEAERHAKQIVNATKPNDHYSIYAIFNNGALRASHGAGNTAHLYGTLTRDVCHEVGHCIPFRLGHSGAYDDRGRLHAYSDGTSFMGKFSSIYLTASQLYFLGWLPVNKVAEYDTGDAPTEYTIDYLTANNDGDHVKAVYMPRTGRPIFLSIPKFKHGYLFALHYSTGGGSQRIKAFSDKYQYQDLLFEKISDGTNFKTVRVSTVPAVKDFVDHGAAINDTEDTDDITNLDDPNEEVGD